MFHPSLVVFHSSVRVTGDPDTTTLIGTYHDRCIIKLSDPIVRPIGTNGARDDDGSVTDKKSTALSGHVGVVKFVRLDGRASPLITPVRVD